MLTASYLILWFYQAVHIFGIKVSYLWILKPRHWGFKVINLKILNKPAVRHLSPIHLHDSFFEFLLSHILFALYNFLLIIYRLLFPFNILIHILILRYIDIIGKHFGILLVKFTDFWKSCYWLWSIIRSLEKFGKIIVD